ncbi:hypothetical protein [Litorilituus sediminis]|uniref:Lipoprotein n=1 Tax=Litorilituus sediminis TaxID=718192 RepID=A0A4V0ZFM5_9GAMM|nr:hypothetical protein [Litorilituus sediminis]QBG34320.1 hypothetical protein EMK97_00465 [Litorilituus sediminis]
MIRNLFVVGVLSSLLIACNSSEPEAVPDPILAINNPKPIEGAIASCLSLEEKFSTLEPAVEDFYLIFYQDGHEPFRLNYKAESQSARWLVYLDGQHSNAFVDIYYDHNFQTSMPIAQLGENERKTNATFIFIDHQANGIINGWSRQIIDLSTECVDSYADETGGVL